MNWFKKVFGIYEPKSEEDVKSKFRMEDENSTLIVLANKQRRFHVGKFETPSVKELMYRLGADGTAPSSNTLTFQHIAGNVGEMIRDPANSGAVFQAASQFNCLEMVSFRFIL